MTNGEKIKELYPKTPTGVRLDVDGTNGAMTFTTNKDWWEAEYKEPTNKNDLGVDADKLISDCEEMSFDIDIFNKPLKVVALAVVKNIVKNMPSLTPQEPCDKCEVGNPCLYCKHEFEPQESEEV